MTTGFDKRARNPSKSQYDLRLIFLALVSCIMETRALFVCRKVATKLASSRDTSNGPDWLDCRVLMREMGTALDARVELGIRHVSREGVESLVVRATAHPYFVVGQAQRQSVFLSATIPGSSAQMGTAVIFRLLLALDYEVSKAWSVRVAT